MSFLLEIVLLVHQPEGNRRNKIRHFSKSQIINSRYETEQIKKYFWFVLQGFGLLVFFCVCLYLNITVGL